MILWRRVMVVKCLLPPPPPSHLLSYWALKEENGSMVTFR